MAIDNPTPISKELLEALDAFNKLLPHDREQFFTSKLPQKLANGSVDRLADAANTPKIGGEPALWVTNYIWIMVISAFIIAFIFTIISIGFGVFRGTLNSDALITVFTTAVGFLAGVLTPSPVNSGNRSA